MGATPLPSATGVNKSVSAAQPGAGADWTMTVPAGKWWYLLAIYAVLTQGATQTPTPILFLDDGGNLFGE